MHIGTVTAYCTVGSEGDDAEEVTESYLEQPRAAEQGVQHLQRRFRANQQENQLLLCQVLALATLLYCTVRCNCNYQ